LVFRDDGDDFLDGLINLFEVQLDFVGEVAALLEKIPGSK
jgi:hypothetical protein